MAEKTGRPRGRPRGSTTKTGKADRIPRDRLVALMDGSTPTTFAERQFCRNFSRMSARDQIDQRLKFESKPRAVPSEEGVSVRFTARFSCPECPHCQELARREERLGTAPEPSIGGAETEPPTHEEVEQARFEAEQEQLRQELEEQEGRNTVPTWRRPL